MRARWERLIRKVAVSFALLIAGGYVWAQPPMGAYQPMPGMPPQPGTPPSPLFPGEPNPIATPPYGYPPPGPMPGGPMPAGPMPAGNGGGQQQPDTTAPGLSGNFFSAFDDRFDGDLASGAGNDTLRSSIFVDMLLMKPAFSRPDRALTTTTGIAGFAPPGNIDFPTPIQMSPRITLSLQLDDMWAVSCSWWQFFQKSDTIAFTTTDPNQQANTPALPLSSAVVSSPSNFFYYSQISPPVDATGAPLPPFPYTSSVSAGSPDFVVIQKRFQMEVFDAELTRYVELGNAVGSLGIGARYAYLSHHYIVTRANLTGQITPPIPNFDSNDSDTDSTYIDGPDFDNVFYGYNFHGVGPKLSLSFTMPANRLIQFNFAVAGSVVLGNRKETEYINSRQRGEMIDNEAGDPIVQDQVFDNGQNVTLVRNTFLFMPTAEVQAGFSFRTGTGSFYPEVKLNAIAQYWWDAGTSTSPTANLFLYGGNVSVGFVF